MKALLQLPRNFVGFLSNVIVELKLVEWVSFRNVIKFTFLVIAIALIITVVVANLDNIFVAIRGLFLNRNLV